MEFFEPLVNELHVLDMAFVPPMSVPVICVLRRAEEGVEEE